MITSFNIKCVNTVNVVFLTLISLLCKFWNKHYIYGVTVFWNLCIKSPIAIIILFLITESIFGLFRILNKLGNCYLQYYDEIHINLQ